MKIQIQVYAHERWWVHTLERIGDKLYWVNNSRYWYKERDLPILGEDKRAGRNFGDGVFPYMEGDF